MTRRFAYHRSIAPMIWALVAISVGEFCIVHLLVALLWSKWVALALTAVTIAGIAWLIVTVRSFPGLPVEMDEGGITMRVGRLKSIWLAWDDVLGLRHGITNEEAKRRDTLRLSLLAFPNVVIELREPLQQGRREIMRVAHRLDDLPSFVAAYAELSNRVSTPAI